MKTKSAPRRFALTALALAVASLAAFAGSGFAKDEAPAPPVKSMKVAILPLINNSPDPGATKIMVDILRDELKKIPAERATFLTPFDTERILTDRNAMDRAYRVSDQWSKYSTLDTVAVAGLDSILLCDALLLGRVNEWENFRVRTVGSGDSHTTVALSFALYDLRTKKKIWTKEPREQRFGQEIDASSGAVTYDATGFIQNKRANEPPRYEDVAADLVRDAFKKFPAK